MIDEQLIHYMYLLLLVVSPIYLGLIILLVINFVINVYDDFTDWIYFRRYFK